MIKIGQIWVFQISLILCALEVTNFELPWPGGTNFMSPKCILICPIGKNVRARSSNVGDVEQIMILSKKFRTSCGSIFCRRTVFGIHFFGPVVVDWI